MQIKLVQDVFYVDPHGGARDHQLTGDLGSGQTARQEHGHLHLTWRKLANALFD